MSERKYLPTLAELVDRLSIIQLKEVKMLPMVLILHLLAGLKLVLYIFKDQMVILGELVLLLDQQLQKHGVTVP